MRWGASAVSGDMTRTAVLALLGRQGPLSRAEIAERLGLSPATVTQVTRRLLGQGLVTELGQRPSQGGRPATLVGIIPNAGHALGVHVAHEHVSGVLTQLDAEVVDRFHRPFDPSASDAVERLIDMIQRQIERAGQRRQPLLGVGVAVPGVVDPETGAVELAPNIRGLTSLSAPKALADLFRQTVVIENDVNLAMLGEAWQGCARGAGNAAFLAIGTGVGLGLIVNGQLARGAKGAAGEIAYLPIGRDLDSAQARDIGAFELEVGAAGILRHYAASDSSPVGSVRELFGRLETGDRAAQAAIEATARSLALAVTALAAVLDPELVVLGGSIGIRPELVERVKAAMRPLFARPVDIRVSALGARAGLVGAVSLAVNRLHNALFGMSGMPRELSLPSAAAGRAAA